MSVLESQRWYIEEIPADDGDAESKPLPESEALLVSSPLLDNNEGACFATLDTGPAAFETSEDKGPDNIDADPVVKDCTADEHAGRTMSTVGWKCTTITSCSASEAPSPRGGCSWTQVGSRYLLFGGADSCQQHFADVHAFDPATGRWEKITTQGSPPSPRSGHSAIAFGDSLIVYGGMNGTDNVTFNDIFELQTDSLEWGSLPCKEAPPRNSHAVVLHENNMVIIGGASPDGQTDDVHIIDLSDLSNLTCRQVDCQTAEKTAPHSESFQRMPAAREMHSACLCSLQTTKDRDPIILVMGGRSVTGVHRDLFSLNTVSWEWRRLKDAPVPRCAHTACLIGNAGIMAIFGGWDGGTTMANDLHLYDVETEAWTTPAVSPRPTGRFAHAACAGAGNSVLIFGGVNPAENVADVVLLTTP